MTEPMPEPQGQRQAIPPRPPVAVGLQERGQPHEPHNPHRRISWRLVLLVAIGLLLLVAVAIWRFTGS
ncbi:MAG: hypothetical protein WDA75_00180 [Candidatus Latescibacterota bacterium]|jgi:hypothetical protein